MGLVVTRAGPNFRKWAQGPSCRESDRTESLGDEANSPSGRKPTRPLSTCPSAHRLETGTNSISFCISAPPRPRSQIGETEAAAACFSHFPQSREKKVLECSSRGGPYGAAVDDPGVRGGGGGRGGRTAHAPGPPRRAEPDRRARVLAPAAHRHRNPLRGLPAPRYLLEEGAQAHVHLGGLHRRRAYPLRENHVQSPEECDPLCFGMPPLLVHLPNCQVQQGYQGIGRGCKAPQGRVEML